MDLNSYFETNKATWNQKVGYHAQSEFYDVDGFRKGKSTLNFYELNALHDLQGKSLLHLQCHFGLDTLSWARRGAKCVGIDFSEEAIKLAAELNKELGLDAKFVCGNVLHTSELITEQFDVVFTSYGVIGWLPDLRPWGKMIAERLKPGGTFYLIEFHPIAWMFDYTTDPPEMKYGYDQSEAIYEEYEGTYANQQAQMTSKEYGWNHSISEVLGALLDAGLTISSFDEYHESPYEIFSGSG